MFQAGGQAWSQQPAVGQSRPSCTSEPFQEFSLPGALVPPAGKTPHPPPILYGAHRPPQALLYHPVQKGLLREQPILNVCRWRSGQSGPPAAPLPGLDSSYLGMECLHSACLRAVPSEKPQSSPKQIRREKGCVHTQEIWLEVSQNPAGEGAKCPGAVAAD